MVRAERNQPTVYFGRPGYLLPMPWPRGDQDNPYDRAMFDFVTGSGQHSVSVLANGSRAYSLAWNALHMDTYKQVEQFWLGQMGQGPWVYIDPSRPNLLMNNQASATQQFNDTRNWMTFVGGLTSNSDPTFVHRPGARRSLRWQFTGTIAATSILDMTWAFRNWWGIPIVPGLSYAFSSWVRPDNIIDSSITMSLRVRWVDATGAQVSETTSGDVVVTAWTRLSVIGAPPVGAVYAQPRYVVNGTTVLANASIYVDEPLFEQDTVVNDWAPGTGVRPVEIMSLGDSVPFAARARTKATMVLRELTP